MSKFSVSYKYELIDKYTRVANRIKRSTDGMKKGFDGASKSVANMGRKMQVAGAVMSAAITLPMIMLSKSMINAASDAEETRSKYSTIFKSLGDGAENTADQFAKSFGLAGTSARKLLGDTGDMLSGFGFSAEAALKLSQRTNELAVDLASFTNFSGGAEGASNALTKALLGERESVKSLGIAILESDVKKKVAQMKSEGMRFATMREAKAYATLEIAISQSKNAIGDYARTQSSFANVQRRVSQRNIELRESFGRILLPAATKVLLKIEELQEQFIGLDDNTKKTIMGIAGFVAVIAPLILMLGTFAIFIGAIGASLAAWPIALVVTGVTALAASFAVLMVKAGSFTRAFAAAGLGVVDVITGAMIGMAGVLADVLMSPIKLLLQVIDMIPFIKIPSGLTDVFAFSKMAGGINDKKSGLLSGMLANNPAASGAANQNTLNGNINVSATDGAKVNSADFGSSAPSNIGTTIASNGM